MALAQKNDYELMVIFTPILSEEGFKEATTTIKNYVTENEGNIINENPWGLKQLAYPIQKKTTGIYWVLEFNFDATLVEKLKVNLNRNENVLRHMITKLDKHAVAYNAKKSGVTA